jgi:putative iron-regulated protein
VSRELVLMASVWVAAGCGHDPPGPVARPPKSAPPAQVTARQVLTRYAELVHETYAQSLAAAARLAAAADGFIANPTEQSLAAAKEAWLAAREPYGRSEAFRFYEGPIDAPKTGVELRLNAWPLNEAYIDYVEGDPKAGIIQRGDIPITEYELAKRNGKEDEADVTLGFHAVEFLLWGQDRDPDGPGHRPLSDYVGKAPAVQRRREYLHVATSLVVKDLQYLVDQWKPGTDNYRTKFLQVEPTEGLRRILTGLAELSGFEMAAERVGVPLDSGNQEDEQSCFSDSTHLDLIANVRGIEAVWSRTGLDQLIRQSSPDLADRIGGNLKRTLTAVLAVEPPIDKILASPPGSPGRQHLEEIVALLQRQSKLFIEAGKVFGVEITVIAE